jgi:hypothetical protein
MERDVKAMRLADRWNEETIERRQYLFVEGQLSRVWRRAFDRLPVRRGIRVYPQGMLGSEGPKIAALLLAITT